jgi:uncharacterized repeat protein (TIGR01451 family)
LSRVSGALLTVAGLVSVSVATGASAWAAPPSPDACATPTSTLSGGGDEDLVVGPGEVLALTSGTYTGRLNDLVEGGTLCVAADAFLGPQTMQKPAGDLVILGTAELPPFTAEAGFDMLVAGPVETGNVTFKGGSSISITTTGSVTTGTVHAHPGSLVYNAGVLDTKLKTDVDSTVLNSGAFSARGGLAVAGSLRNTGHLTVLSAALDLDPGSTMSNECVIESQDDVTVDSSSGVTNAGIIRANGGALRVSSSAMYRQTPVGITITQELDNEGTITDFGRYRITGTTRSALTFAGANAAEPITVQDLTPPAAPMIFDQQSGTVANTVTGVVPDPPAGATVGTCAGGGSSGTADVTLRKEGPATADPGGPVTYTITVHNVGPGTATGLTVTDTLPPPLAGVSASGGGTIAAGTVTWTVASLAAGAEATFTVSGTAPTSGSFSDRVAATTTTFDPDPANNDGSALEHNVSTEVMADPPVNRPPTVADAVYGGRATFPTTGSVAMSDPDNGQRVLASLGSDPVNGTVSINGEGVFDYRPTGTFTGTDEFTVVGCDNGDPQACDTGTVTIVVAPGAGDDSAETTRDTPVRIEVLLNDVGDTAGGPAVTAGPDHGSVTADGDAFVYTPTAGFTGIDEFRYRICSSGTPTACGIALVTVTVTAPTNQPPSVGDTAVDGPAGEPVQGRVLASDPDAGQTVTFSLNNTPNPAGTQVNADGTFSFRSPNDAAGVFTFTVRACDDFDPPACVLGTVTATITPVALADTVTTVADTPITFDVTANDLGGVGTPSIVVPGPASGTVTVAADGRITYAPNTGFAGADAFEYRVCATANPGLCTTGQVVVDVGVSASQPNRPPTLDPAALTVTATVPGVVDLDSADPDPGQTLAFAIATAPGHGTATVSVGGRVEYSPADTFTGRDQLTVRVCDDAVTPACTSAPVSVTVLPLLGDDAATVEANGSVDIPSENNDIGDVGPITALSTPANGTAEIGDSIRYTPNPNFVGTDSFTYDVCAANPGDTDVCATARVEVAVLPIAQDDASSTYAGETVTISVVDNDTVGANPTGDVLTGPVNGTATVAPGGVITYSPSGTFTGPDTLTYQICEATTPPLCSQATVSVPVVPAVNGLSATTVQDQPVAIEVTANDFGDATTAVVTVPPANGTVTGGGLELVRTILGGPGLLGPKEPLVYTPLPGFTGVDTFRYTRCSITDPSICDEAVVVVNVLLTTQPIPPTQPPPTSPASPPPAPAAPAPTGPDGLAASGPDGLAATGLASIALLALAALLITTGTAPVIESRLRRSQGPAVLPAGRRPRRSADKSQRHDPL